MALPRATSPGAVHLQVSDLGRSVDYYVQVLGLQVLARAGAEAVLGPHGPPASLLHLQERAGASPVPRGGALGLFHFAILVPSRADLGRFLAHLGEHRSSSGLTGLSDHLVSEAVYLSDPDGLGIEVYADRPRSTWRRDPSGQLEMATLPLDARSVIAAGAGTPWAGLPGGTTMGHVHLHVGDLGQARAFYGEALGLEPTVWEYPGALFLAAGGYHHHLGTNTWSRGGPAADDQARLLAWDLVVPGEDAARDAVARLGAAGHPAEHDNTGWRVADPWGTVVRIIAADGN